MSKVTRLKSRPITPSSDDGRVKLPTSRKGERECSSTENEMMFLHHYENTEDLREVCHVNGISASQFARRRHLYQSLDIFLGFWPSMKSVSFFTGLTSLTIVQQPTIEKIEGIEHCPLLESLWITECSLRRIENLDNCTKLRELHLSSNKIERIENLNQLKELKVLWLNDNCISKLEGLESCELLQQLWLCRNKIDRIETALDRNQNLTELNLSDNLLGNFKGLLNLSRLPNLVSLSLSDPHFGDNPVCRLCNFQTYVICQLTRLCTLDTMRMTEETKQIAEATYMKKKMYYNMRIKTLKRNNYNILRKTNELCRSQADKHNSRINLLFLQKKSLEQEINEIKWYGRSCGSKRNSTDEDLTKWQQLLIKKRDSLNSTIYKLLLQSSYLYQQFQNLRTRLCTVSEGSIYRLLLELETGGNIRLEDGNPSDIWYSSCVDLIKSRLSLDDFKVYGIAGVKINRVTRIHNRYLRNRFEGSVEEILIKHYEQVNAYGDNDIQSVDKKTISTQQEKSTESNASDTTVRPLEYLFYADPPIPSRINPLHAEKIFVAENGFHSIEECIANGLDQPIRLVNSVSTAVIPHIAAAMHVHGSDVLGKPIEACDIENFKYYGWKVNDTITSELEASKSAIDNGEWELPDGCILIGKAYLGKSKTIDSIEESLDKSAYSDVQSLLNVHPIYPNHKQHFIYERTLVLPEYIVEFQYVMDTENNSIEKNTENLSSILELLDTTVPQDGDRTISKLSSQELVDLGPVTTPLSRFINASKLIQIDDFDVDEIRNVIEMDPVLKPRNPVLCLAESTIQNYAQELNFSRIVYLNFNKSGLKRIEHLDQCVNLQILVLSFNEIQRIEGIDHLVHLERLELGYNKIRRIENIRGLNALHTLELNNNSFYRVEDINTLKLSVPQIRELDLRRNPLCEVKGYHLLVVQKLKKLQIFDTQPVAVEDRTAAKRISNTITTQKILNHAKTAIPLMRRDTSNYIKNTTLNQTVINTTPPIDNDKYSDTPEIESSEFNNKNNNNTDEIPWKEILELEIKHERITRIQQLEELTNLRRLNLADNEIMKIEGLEKCTLLEELNLEENRIVVLEGLHTLLYLNKLDLGKNRINTIENINMLVNLTQLSLEDNNITTLEGLSSLVKLMELYIGNNQIAELKQIQHLKSLPKLIILDLSGNKVYRDENYRMYTIYFLRRIKVLDGLNITTTEQSEAKNKYSGKLTTEFLIEKLGNNFDRVQELELSSCRIREIEEIHGNKFSNLKELNLEHNFLTNLNGLNNIPTLQVLKMNYNRIEKLIPENMMSESNILDHSTLGLYACRNLEVLHLSNNQITDITLLGLHILPKLRVLTLNGNEITQLNGLSYNTDLRELNLQKNKIKHFNSNSTAGLSNLRTLRIDDNGLRSLSNFNNLFKLQSLNASNNKISDLDEIDRLTIIPFSVEMFFLNNPVAKKQMYRPTMIYKFPTLRYLDGKDILFEERERVDTMFSQDRPNSNVFPFEHEEGYVLDRSQQPQSMIHRTNSSSRGVVKLNSMRLDNINKPLPPQAGVNGKDINLGSNMRIGALQWNYLNTSKATNISGINSYNIKYEQNSTKGTSLREYQFDSSSTQRNYTNLGREINVEKGLGRKIGAPGMKSRRLTGNYTQYSNSRNSQYSSTFRTSKSS